MTDAVAVSINTESSETPNVTSAFCDNKAGSAFDSNSSSLHSVTTDIGFPLENANISERGLLIQHNTRNQHQYIHEADIEHSTHNIRSPAKSPSLSQCRYCYDGIRRKSSVSQCHCNTSLCKACLMKEVVLTYTRSNHDIECTVCRYSYEAKIEFKCKSRDCKRFFRNHMVFCGLKDEEYLVNSMEGKVGYGLVIFGIGVWIVCTAFVFTYPPYELPSYLYYLIAVFDLIVGIATLWFVIKCRWLTAFFLSLLYCCRCLYLLLGWIVIIDVMDVETINMNIMSYFISFSFIAFIILSVCWITDIYQQIIDYKVRHRTLVINGIRIDINAINDCCCTQESEEPIR